MNAAIRRPRRRSGGRHARPRSATKHRCQRAGGRRSTTTRQVGSLATKQPVKYRYTKYTGDLMDEIDLEDLVSKLSDLLLSSGFSNPWDPSDSDEDRTMQALHDAILDALFSGGVLSDEAMQQLLGEPADGDQEGVRQQLEDLIQQIIDRMMERGFITCAPDLDTERERRAGAGGGVGEDTSRVQFEVTDKALVFLGYRALRDLLGSVGRSSSGLHDTWHLSTGVEAIAAPKPYEFGD